MNLNYQRFCTLFLLTCVIFFGSQQGHTQWMEIHPADLEGYDLFDLHRDGDTLVAVGYIADGTNNIFNSVILTSVDNATTWEETTIDGRFLKSMTFTDAGIGYIGGFGVGSTSFIMKSDDGGLTWQDHFIDAANAGITEIDFIDESNGYASGYGSMQFATPNLYQTTDGGNTWSTKIETSPQFTTFDKMTFIDGETYALSSVYFSGSVLGKDLCYSADSGKNWILIHENAENLGGMAWLDGLTGFLVTESGSIQKSTDGGVNWLEVHNTNDKALFGINERNGNLTAFGASGLIIKSTDGGASWKKQETEVDLNISGIVHFSDRSFALGQDGIILQLGGETGAGSGPGEDPDDDPKGEWPVGVNDLTDGTLRVYPNPVSDMLHMEADFEIATITVLNAMGQVVSHQNATDQSRMNVAAYPAGLYSIIITEKENGSSHRRSILVK